jgi:hypothetical protein
MASEWRGRITQVDYANRNVVVEPAVPYPAAWVGRYVRITNPFSDCTHLIQAAENIGEASQLTLELDPRICEGPVVKAAESAITSGVTLTLTGLRYCHGKTLANEDGSVAYRLSGVTGRQTVWIDQANHGVVSTKKLEEQFGDPDGDGIRRFLVYDYGVGDEVTAPTVVSLQKSDIDGWTLETSTRVSLTLPGREPATFEPGHNGEKVSVP